MVVIRICFFLLVWVTSMPLFAQITAHNSLNIGIYLTEQEKIWLQAYPIIRVGMDHEYAPYEWLNKDGNFVGLAVDYLRLLEQKLGVRFEIMKGKSWSDVVEMGKKGEIDVLTSIVQTPERLNNTFYFQSLIVTHKR